jgi:hypothetical protein
VSIARRAAEEPRDGGELHNVSGPISDIHNTLGSTLVSSIIIYLFIYLLYFNNISPAIWSTTVPKRFTARSTANPKPRTARTS